jgi:hypothetical protein
MHKPSLIRVREWVKARSPAVKLDTRQGMGVAKNSLAIVGFASLITMTAMQANPQLASGLFETIFPAASNLIESDADAQAVESLMSDTAHTQVSESTEKRMTAYLASRFRVSQDAMSDMVRYALLAAEKHRLDPALVLAVAAVESGFNPYAASPMGAKGLMQVMSSIHHEKFRVYSDIRNPSTNPQVNLMVGAEILRDCINRGGGVNGGLKLYLGVGTGDDNGYVARVIAEAARIRAAASGKMLDALAPRNNLVKVASSSAAKAKPAQPAAKPRQVEAERAARLLSEPGELSGLTSVE